MVKLTKRKKIIYKENFENDIIEIITDYGMDFNLAGKHRTLFESQIVAAKNVPGGSQRRNYDTVLNLEKLQKVNKAKVHVPLIDDPNYDLNDIIQKILDVAFPLGRTSEGNEFDRELLTFMCSFIKECSPESLRYPTTRDKTDDYKFIRKDLIEVEKEYLNNVFFSKETRYYIICELNMKLHILSLGENKIDAQTLKEGICLIRNILIHLYSKSLDDKHKMLIQLSNDYSMLRCQFGSARCSQLGQHGFSKKETRDIFDKESMFFNYRAFLNTYSLRSCALLESFDDEECVGIFGFEKLEIMHLSLLLAIPDEVPNLRRKLDIDSNGQKLDSCLSFDPLIQLMVLLFQMESRSNLALASRICGISKNDIADILEHVVLNLANKFKHLLNIGNCVYNNSYMRLLVDKSYTTLPGIRLFSTHMLGTMFEAPDGEEYSDVSSDSSSDSEEQSEQPTCQFLRDNLGLFVDVTTTKAKRDDMKVLKDSKLDKRLGNLMFGENLLQVVGSSGHFKGIPEYNAETGLFNYDRQPAENLYGAPELAHLSKMELDSVISYYNISRHRNSINNVVEYEDHFFSRLLADETPCHPEFNATCENNAVAVILNLKTIMRGTLCSQSLSDVLPPDMYLHMWSALS